MSAAGRARTVFLRSANAEVYMEAARFGCRRRSLGVAVGAFGSLALYSHVKAHLRRGGRAGQKPAGQAMSELEKPLFCGLVG